MGISLGNLKLEDVVKDEHLEKIQSFLEENDFSRVDKTADVEKRVGNYHIYEMPKEIHICGKEKAHEFADFLKRQDLVNSAFKGRIAVAACDAPKTNT